MATLDALQQLPELDPAILQKLSVSDQKKLLEVLRTAQQAQESEYRTAVEKALSHVPTLLRGAVRKIVMG